MKPEWGSIERLPSGRLRLRGTLEGERVTVGTFDTPAEALGAARTMARALKGKRRGRTVEGWGRRWLDRRETRGIHRSVTDTRGLWERYIYGTRIANMLLRELKPRHVRQWIDELVHRPSRQGGRLGHSTIRNAITALSTALEDAVEAGHISHNPCRAVRRPEKEARTEDPWTFLDAGEVRELLAHPALERRSGPRVRRIITAAVFTGLRSGELWGLTWPDVRTAGDEPHLRVRFGNSRGGPTKSGKPRRVPLLPPARDVFAELRELNGATRIAGHVFLGRGALPHGKGYDAGWAGKWTGKGDAHRYIDGWRERCEVRSEVRFHDFRHTFASHLVMGTWGRAWRLEEVRELLGHTTIKTTERYAHLAQEGLSRSVREAEEAWEWGG